MAEKEALGSRLARNRKRILRYLLLGAVATSLFASTTLAKFSSVFSGTVQMQIAAFAAGGTVDFDVTLEDMYPGCETRKVPFSVQNYSDSAESDVMLTYTISVETTGNLPLKFTLIGQTESGDNNPNSLLAGSLSEELVATGGRLPVASMEGKKKHSYLLEVDWPQNGADGDYSHEIDLITVSVTTVQVNPAGEA